MEGKFMSGVIGGAIAGTLKDIPDSIFHYVLKVTHITFLGLCWDDCLEEASRRVYRTCLLFLR